MDDDYVCVECGAPIPDMGTWGYCDDCWSDDKLEENDNA